MAGEVFISYRRDDVPGDARGIRDALSVKLGTTAVFLDIENLLVGERFDDALARHLNQCKVLVAVMGPRWNEILAERLGHGERDFVREEIAAAITRGIQVIPVRVGRKGQMPALPSAANLPEDIRELVRFQGYDVSHERFRREAADLADAIALGLRARRSVVERWRGPATAVLAIAVIASLLTMFWSDVRSLIDDVNRNVPRLSIVKPADEKLTQPVAASAQPEPAATSASRPSVPSVANQTADLHAQPSIVETPKETPKAAPEARPGTVLRDCDKTCPSLVVIPAGSFLMGPGPEEGAKSADAQRLITFAKPFLLGRTEVTFEEWDACVAGGGCPAIANDLGWGRGKRPVIGVSWDNAMAYVGWLSTLTGKPYRLPSEAEWEYAARAGTTTAFSTGDTITSRQANFDARQGYAGGEPGEYRRQTTPVGSFPANAFGLHDMHGNAWEWVADNWHGNFFGAPDDGSAWLGGDVTAHIRRGGSWFNQAANLRSHVRVRDTASAVGDTFGFRVARDAD